MEFRINIGSKVNLFALIPPILFMGGLFYIGEPYIYQVMTDPVGLLNGEVWSGAGSNLGVFIWSSSASVAIFSGYILKNDDKGAFLFMLGSLSLFLSLDDLFMFHDIILPHFGIHELFVYILYAFIGCFILIRYLSIISHSNNFFFIFGGTLFCLSIVMDLLPPTPILGFAEDAAKFIGICSWSFYLMITSYLFVKNSMTNSNV